jgi:hypothetical protein
MSVARSTHEREHLDLRVDALRSIDERAGYADREPE